MLGTRWRSLAAAVVAILALVSLVSVAGAQSGTRPVGTIRGGVYQDFDGDGLCSGDEGERRIPVTGIDLHFSTSGASFTLFSGANGTYGLIPVTAGEWQVKVAPDPNLWLVTSRNPLQVDVTSGAGAVQTGVDFCLLRISGPALLALPTGAGPGDTPPMSGGTPDQSEAVRDLDPLVESSIISRALLTNPPEPRPPENIEEVLETPVEADVVPAAWLSYLNRFREIGGLSALNEAQALTSGSQWHSRYMVVNDTPIAHKEDPGNALYDPAGDRAAKNGNIFATTQIAADHTWAMNFWISAPFHLTPILDPGLGEVGYGQYNQAVGTFTMAAVLDARSNLADPPGDVSYPLFFPGNGASTWVVRHSLYEWPDAMVSCPGYSRPSGPPLVLQLGSGDVTPRVSSHAFYADGQLTASCRFDETSYSNPNAYAQKVGRDILDERDAVVIIPRQPLAVGKTYRVEITVSGQQYSWEFTTQRGPS